MNGLLAPGPFTRPGKISRGPWFKENFGSTDDGLEYYYTYSNAEGETSYLLSNNIAHEDRDRLERLFNGYERARGLAWFGGAWVGVEAVTRI